MRSLCVKFAKNWSCGRYYVWCDMLIGKLKISYATTMYATTTTGFGYCLDSGMDSPPLLLYSSASHHLTSDAHQVPNAVSYQGSDGALIGNSQTLQITKVGSGSLLADDKCLLSVKQLLHTPYVSSNLLSV